MNAKPLPALLVEDDPSWQSLLIEILSDYGLQLDVTDNLQSAVEQVKKVPYRLAVVDLSLAGKNHHNQDGLQVLDAIRRHIPGCICILLTGHASVELAVSSIQNYGAYTCLQKENFRRAEFWEVIHQALASQTPSTIEDTATGKNLGSDETSTQKDTETEPSVGLALVIEDDAGWHSLLIELLNDCGYQVDVSTSYGEAQGLLKRGHYQLAIADISLASSLEPEQNLDGYLLLKTIQGAKIPTIVVSGSADPALIDQAYEEYQIFACFEKQSFRRKAFTDTIQQVTEQTSLAHHLTERELEVLALLAKGLGNKEIAANLFISTNTVKRHLKSIYPKLDVNTRAAASAYAIRLGLGNTLSEE